jgi:phosphoglycolate phosphatase
VRIRRIVLFDIDGTLMRGAGPEHRGALIEAGRSVMGATCTLDGVDTSGRLDRDLLYIILANAGVAKRRIIPKMTRLMEVAQQHYVLKCKADFSSKLCPGVRSTLEMLSQNGVPMGLVTGNLSSIAWRKLENAGIDKYFSFGAFAEEGTTRARIAKLAVWKARRKYLEEGKLSVTLIGDHVNDIEAARANGFRSIAVATGVMSADQLSEHKPDVLLNNLDKASIDLICG